MTVSAQLQAEIDKAFDYRGHVTVALKDGSSVVGFLYNRDFARGYVDLMIKDSDERRRLEISQLSSVALTGEDFAAGKSFEDYQNKLKAGKKA